MQHVSVGDLLRRIKNDSTHPKASVVTPSLNKQELMDAKTLVPILVTELERSQLPEQMGKGTLMDGFPRNFAQQQEFEKVVSGSFTNRLIATCHLSSLCPLMTYSTANLLLSYSSIVLRRLRNSDISLVE